MGIKQKLTALRELSEAPVNTFITAIKGASVPCNKISIPIPHFIYILISPTIK